MNKFVHRQDCIALLICIIGFVIYIFVQQHRFDTLAESRIYDFNARHSVVSQADLLSFVNMKLEFFNFTNLYAEGQPHLQDPFVPHISYNLLQFGLDTDMIGYLSIPAIDMDLPIFVGTSDANLGRGVAHLLHSSFPVGGVHTHAVIAGNRRLNYARLFQDIEYLEVGDEIYVTNFYQRLVYVVVNTQIIPPGQLDALRIQDYRDLLTLVTQHNNGNIFNRNGYRYVVTAERMDR